MRRHQALSACLILAIAAAASSPRPVRAQRATVERHAFVGVTNSRGDAHPGLTAADFVVREDDVAREVLRVSATAPPSHVALLVDNSDQVNAALIELRAGLVTFMNSMTSLPAPPSMSITTYAERPTVAVPWTTSDIVLERGIQRIFPRPGSGSYLLDAVMETCQTLKKEKAERPVIVAFVIEASPAFSNILHTRVADGLKEAGASLWTIQLQQNGGPGSSQEERERQRLVSDVTAWSGGTNTPVLSRQGLGKAFSSVAAAITGRYDVVYGRPETLVPPSRLAVETRDRSLRVTASRWAGR